MKVSDVIERTGVKPINDFRDKIVDKVYISDMVSDVITGSR